MTNCLDPTGCGGNTGTLQVIFYESDKNFCQLSPKLYIRVWKTYLIKQQM